jgi:hypothetical protein
MDRPIAEIAMRPIVLDVVATPLRGETDGGGGGDLGLGGGLGGIGGGGGAAPAPDGAVQLEVFWELGDEAPAFAGGAASLCDAPATCIAEELLRIELTGGGEPTRALERTIGQHAPGAPTPAGHRRYAIEVIDVVVTDDDAEDARAALEADVGTGQAALDRERDATGEDAARRDRLLALDVTGEMAHAIAMKFAAASDRATASAATFTGVTVTRPVPRVLITSFETDEAGATQVSLDLRLDEVEATGDPGATAHFQIARGMAESRLEGVVVASLIGRPAVTTARVMDEAFAAGVDVRGLRGANAELPGGVPDAAAVRIRAALAAGHEVILPAAAVQVDGVARWGWWDVDPATMRTIGVLESGQHQGMAEYNQMLEEVGLNPDMAFMIGMLIGSNYAAFAIAGEMLKTGAITEEFLRGLLEQLQAVACTMCPRLGASAGVSQSVAGDCFSQGIERFTAVDESFSFCEKYNAGFKCAVSVMTAGLLGELDGYAVTASASLNIGCAEAGTSLGTGDM